MATDGTVDVVGRRASSQRSCSRHENDSDQTDVDVEHTPSSLPKPIDAPPDGGYGWVCVVCCFFINGEIQRTSEPVTRRKGLMDLIRTYLGHQLVIRCLPLLLSK
jgi:hypothetical protein